MYSAPDEVVVAVLAHAQSVPGSDEKLAFTDAFDVKHYCAVVGIRASREAPAVPEPARGLASGHVDDSPAFAAPHEASGDASFTPE